MIIPQTQHLHSQNFRYDLCEFVWRFPTNQEQKKQFILQIKSNAEIYMEESVIFGDVICGEKTTFDVSCNLLPLYTTVCDEKNWSAFKMPSVYNNFQNGKDLIPLITDSLNFLNQ